MEHLRASSAAECKMACFASIVETKTNMLRVCFGAQLISFGRHSILSTLDKSFTKESKSSVLNTLQKTQKACLAFK